MHVLNARPFFSRQRCMNACFERTPLFCIKDACIHVTRPFFINGARMHVLIRLPAFESVFVRFCLAFSACTLPRWFASLHFFLRWFAALHFCDRFCSPWITCCLAAPSSHEWCARPAASSRVRSHGMAGTTAGLVPPRTTTWIGLPHECNVGKDCHA
jgi:hypothetical protein